MGDNPRSHAQQSGAPAAVGPDALPLLMMSGKRRHSLLRSEPMVMLQFIVQAESCAETVEELGELGAVMFCDLNEGATAFQRNFVAQMRECDDVERCLRYIGDEVEKAQLVEGQSRPEFEPIGGYGSASVSRQSSAADRLANNFEEMRRTLKETVKDLKQLHTSESQLATNYNHLVELSHVLQKCDDIFSEARKGDSTVVPRSLSSAELAAQAAADAYGDGGGGATPATPGPLPRAATGRGAAGSSSDPTSPFPTMPGGGIDLEGGLRGSGMSGGGLQLSGEAQTRLGYIAGVVSRGRLVAFERVIFRATRGNMYLRHADISQQVRDPHTGELVYKSVFIIFFSGQRALAKVTQICDTFGANRYTYPSQFGQRAALLTEVQTRIDDLQQVISHASSHRAHRLAELAQQMPKWRSVALKQKAVYRILNMWNYDLTRKCLIAEAWCPVSSYEETQSAVRRGAARSGAQVPSIVNVIETDEKPPTYFRQNKFTAGFQGIVDGYGVPRCGEINPTPFTIITYPFLFGVMFGDVGHGFLVLLVALYFILREKKFMAMREQDIGDILGYPWHGRYVLLLMALFSIYCGFIYNDFFGLMADLFGSAYDPPIKGESRSRRAPGAVYPLDSTPRGTTPRMSSPLPIRTK